MLLSHDMGQSQQNYAQRITYVSFSYHVDLRPLHTWAKSHDHEFVRAQKKVSKDRPNRPPKSCSVKSYVTGPLTNCYFNEFPFMRVLTHDKIE